MTTIRDIRFPRGRTGAVLVAFLAVAPAGAAAQGFTPSPAAFSEVAPVAQEALKTALAVARKSKALDTLGLRSSAEADRAVLGNPIGVHEIGYEKLLTWQPAMDPAAVFVGPPQILYPVMVGTEPRSALTLVRKDTGWELASFGDVQRVAAIFAAREALRKDAGAAAEQTALVVVPAFRLEFVAETRSDRTLLRPIAAEPATEAGIRGTVDVARTVELLAVHAREYDKKYGEAIRQRRLVH